MHTRFGLIMLGAALVGCPGDDGDGAETTSDDGTTSTTMTPSTTASTTTPPPTTSTGGTTAQPTTADPTTGSATDDDTGTTASTGTTGSTGSDTGTGSSSTTAGLEPCQAGCQVEVDCGFCSTEWTDVDECIEWCEGNLVKAGEFADFCQWAWENVHACVGTLDCTEFTDWCDRNPPFDYPCLTEDLNLEFECKGQ